jgi:hypothetical protein
MIKIINSKIVTAFDTTTIGTKVTNESKFLKLLEKEIKNFDFTGTKVPGQGHIKMPDDAIKMVSSGLARTAKKSINNYIVREYRGQMNLYLQRQFAEPATAVSAIVYTRSAYLSDPDIKQDPEEKKRIQASNCTHVLVAVLTSCGEAPPLTYTRFVKNLAGGNREFFPDNTSVAELSKKAKEVAAFWDKFCPVAD